MKDGSVIENGGYKALLEQDGAFASMWKKQIFTEAEIMAQAEENDLIDLDADEAPGGALPKDVMNGGTGAGGGDAALEITATKEEIEREVEQLNDGPKDNGDTNAISAKAEVMEAMSEPAGEAETTTEGSEAIGEIETLGQGKVQGFDVSAVNEDTSSVQTVTAAESDRRQQTTATTDVTDEPANMEQAPVVSDSAAEDLFQPEHQLTARPATTPVKNQATPHTARSSIPFPSSSSQRPVSWAPESDRSTPEKRLSFPRMTSSQSHASDISDLESGSTTPSRSSRADDGDEKMGDKARKRLNSIKGFVRRISDQGLSRSPSMGGKGAKSPMGELDEAQAMAGASLTQASEPEPASAEPAEARPPTAAAQGGNAGEQGKAKGKDGKKKKKGKGKK